MYLDNPAKTVIRKEKLKNWISVLVLCMVLGSSLFATAEDIEQMAAKCSKRPALESLL